MCLFCLWFETWFRPVLARLWLEKILGEADAKTSHHFSAHTPRTKTTHRNFSALKTLQKADKSTFRPSGKKTTKRHNKMKESPHPVQRQNVQTATQIEGLKPKPAHRGLSLPTGKFRIRTSHVSFRLHVTPCQKAVDMSSCAMYNGRFRFCLTKKSQRR